MAVRPAGSVTVLRSKSALMPVLSLQRWTGLSYMRGIMSYKISVIIEKDGNGYYAYCPELDGCQTQGDTFEEVMTNMREATELYLETLSEEERRERLSHEIMTTSVEVNVA